MIMVQLADFKGKRKDAPIGFSITTLIFGQFVPLVRGDIKWFFIMLLPVFFTGFVATLIFACFYNEVYIKDLITKGFLPIDNLSHQKLLEMGINLPMRNIN